MRFASLLLAVLLAGRAAEAAGLERVGYAYDRASGAPLYSEHHFQQFDGADMVAHRVEYRNPSGTRFAGKTLHYGGQPFAPAFRLDDSRDGYAEGGRQRGSVYEMFRIVDGREKKAEVAAGPDLVVDAGFDRFVQACLGALRRGEARKVRLGIPGRLASMSFVIEPAPRATARAEEIELRVRPDSLMRFIVDPIHLTYDVRSGRLRRYVGISNIRNASGERHDARIVFPPDGRRPDGFRE